MAVAVNVIMQVFKVIKLTPFMEVNLAVKCNSRLIVIQKCTFTLSLSVFPHTVVSRKMLNLNALSWATF